MDELKKALGNVSAEELQMAIATIKLHRLNRIKYNKIATQL